MGAARTTADARPSVDVVVDGEVPCAEDVRRDERLLRAGAAAVRVAVLSDRALSVGVGVREAAPLLRRAEDAGIPVVRRSTGGTGILHGPGDLAWTLTLPRDHALVGRDYARGFARLGEGVVRFLRAEGHPAAWVAPPGLSDGCCLLGSRGEVLAVGERILGGAAQHASRTTLLHHGILPYRVDPVALARVFDLDPEVARRRLLGLGDLVPGSRPEALARLLAASLAATVRGTDRVARS